MSDIGARDGQQLGNYRLIQLLGRGNSAEVYLGQHVHLNTLAAIKVLQGPLTDQDQANFLNEARAIAHLRHPHIVQILDFGVEDDVPFLVMEYAPDGNLRQRHKEGARLALETILPYVRQIADALQFAHDQNLIHRDIKPENMLLGHNNQLLLSDFGIAVLYPRALSHTSPQQDIAGTVPYMAPEQLQAHALPASDQYALAIMTYEWLCGERPFNGTLPEIAIKHTLAPPPSLRERVTSISLPVEQVILKALAKNPQQRFAHIHDFARALEEASRTTPTENHTLPLRDDSPYFSNLPAQLTSLVGRELEVLAVSTLLQRPDVRLVTLTGTGGIGKTRLSLEVGANLLRAFRDGIYFAPLASITDSALVISTIARTLGLQHTYTLRPQPPTEHMEYVKSFLREKQCLLLLDNFEQVISAAPTIAELLGACPRVKILVTSRAALHVSGEHEFSLPPLALPDGTSSLPVHELTQYAAIALFLQRAMAIKPDFNITTANVQAIASICRRLDGLPLAIELAAARVKLLPPQALLQRLSHPLNLLTGGRQNAPERHQTLRNTIAWSYDLLDAAEQQLFRRVSVFVGSCSLEAIEALYNNSPDKAMLVLDGVSSLIDKSLLRQVEQGDEPRILMLETIREYALEMLAASGEEHVSRHAHALYYMTLAESSERELVGPQQTAWLERLELEHDNLRAALDWSLQPDADAHETQSRVEIALRLVGALRRFWQMHGHLNEGQTFTEKVLSASHGIPVSTQARAKALIAAGTLASIQNDYDRTETYCRESLRLFRQLEDHSGIALSLFLLSVVPMMKGDNLTTRVLTEEALTLFREMDDRERIAWSLSTLGLIDTQEEKYTSAQARYEESLALHRKLSNKRGIATSLLRLAQLLFISQGDQARLASLLEECLTLYNELGEKEGIANVTTLSAQLAFRRGDIASARAHIETSTFLYREIGQQRGLAESLAILARTVLAQGNRTEARSLYDESLQIATELNHRWLIAACLEGRASIAAEENQLTLAAQLWGAAEALRETIQVPIPRVDRADYELTVTAVRTRMQGSDFTTAWNAGRAMSPAQAMTSQGPGLAPSPLSPDAPPSPLPPTSSYPAGLTAREVEVLRLVAHGLTSSAIARKLRISEKTVAHHLTHIFNKTNSENRAAAVAFAIRHNLA